LTNYPGSLGRILSGVGANASGQVVTTGIQLVSLPIFLHVWTITQYGEWLLLSAIPGYFSIADAGVGTVAMNKMTILSAQNDSRGSNETFQSALVLTATVAAALFLATMAVVWSIEIGPLDTDTSRATLSMLILVALLNVFSSLVDAVFRAAGHFSFVTYMLSTGRLVEWAGGMAALLVFGTMTAVAAGCLVARIVVTALLVNLARRRHPEFTWGTRHATRREFRELLGPGLAFLALPLGNAITIQGATILVGSFFGVSALAAFNTYRTIARLPIQLLAMLSRSMWPEMSRLFGRRDYGLLRRMYRQGTLVAVVVCGVLCIALYLGGEAIVTRWSEGKVPFVQGVFTLLLVATLANCAWQVGQVLLSATNCHQTLSAYYILTAALSILTAMLLPSSWGMSGMAACLMMFEVVMLGLSHHLVRRPLGMLA
jgi:O-antigen/teichoic acid export membrane protein